MDIITSALFLTLYILICFSFAAATASIPIPVYWPMYAIALILPLPLIVLTRLISLLIYGVTDPLEYEIPEWVLFENGEYRTNSFYCCFIKDYSDIFQILTVESSEAEYTVSV